MATGAVWLIGTVGTVATLSEVPVSVCNDAVPVPPIGGRTPDGEYSALTLFCPAFSKLMYWLRYCMYDCCTRFCKAAVSCMKAGGPGSVLRAGRVMRCRRPSRSLAESELASCCSSSLSRSRAV
uniref:Putative secreted protein n=1 Tax=Anopheles triannulatus TaxID=58253 RepID=A0A2M4B3W7_9DIPT